MTTEHPSPEGAQDEALRLADALLMGKAMIPGIDLPEAAAELRRLHARVQELERAVAHAEMAAETEARYSDARCVKAAADEREACAAACEGLGYMSATVPSHAHAAYMDCARAIRARGAQGESNG